MSETKVELLSSTTTYLVDIAGDKYIANQSTYIVDGVKTVVWDARHISGVPLSKEVKFHVRKST